MVYGNHKILDKIENRFGRRSPQNLISYIVGAMAIVYVFDYIYAMNTGISLYKIMMFDRAAIFSGQIWRIISFIFLPPASSVIFIIFALYFYWLMGSSLERKWGSFRFNLFYSLGLIGSIAAGFITGYTVNLYLNMSLFLAFAAVFPDFQIMLFFIAPVKAKWLAWVCCVYLTYDFIVNDWSIRAAIIASFINIIIFFGTDYIRYAKYRINHFKYKIKTNKYQNYR
ncbi:MAG: rhomboid family intramembrane serine protease [Clostridia bacterium]|nr:rhomboid family intramembrane serine protease [Clostridia bacterium]